MDYRRKRIVVTGGAGFIGSAVCRRLVELGASEIVAIDSLRYGDLSNLGDTPSVKVVRHTLGTDDPALLGPLLDGADGLFHLAAEKHNQSIDSPRDVMRANIEGTQALYAAAVSAGVPRIVFSSSLYAYGRMLGTPMREDEVPQPRTIYGISKLAGELLLAHAARDGAVAARALRYFFVYGPRQWAGMGYKSVIIKNAERLLAGQRALVVGDGTQALDYVFVEDVVDATLRALATPVADPRHVEVLNVSSGRAVQVNELLEALCKVAGKPFAPEHGAADWTAGTSRAGENARIAASLGWKPTTTLDEGLRRTWAFVAKAAAT
ncbi:MAG: NAD-dependent epimerase/dehydratase family protein [Polyangia bacterium]